jgi:hypothetical protein
MTTVVDDLIELKRLAPEHGDGGTDLSGLQTAEELYAWLITCARQDDQDEGHAVELFARHSGATAAEVRRIAGVLKALGYAVASDRLLQIAGRRKHDLRPLWSRARTGRHAAMIA